MVRVIFNRTSMEAALLCANRLRATPSFSPSVYRYQQTRGESELAALQDQPLQDHPIYFILFSVGHLMCSVNSHDRTFCQHHSEHRATPWLRSVGLFIARFDPDEAKRLLWGNASWVQPPTKPGQPPAFLKMCASSKHSLRTSFLLPLPHNWLLHRPPKTVS